MALWSYFLAIGKRKFSLTPKMISFLAFYIFLKAFDLQSIRKQTTFACQKEKIMNTMMNTLSRFERLVSSLAVSGKLDVDFHGVCRMLHVSPYSLEEVIERQLGMTGDEILDAYRSV